jgi:GGDEF domain-containing protein
MAVLEVEGFKGDVQNRDRLLLDVAERLQNVFEDATSIGRLDANSFGIVAFLPAELQFGRRLEQFGNELREVREGLRVIGGTVSVPKAGPYDLEQLFEEARPKPVTKPAILAD